MNQQQDVLYLITKVKQIVVLNIKMYALHSFQVFLDLQLIHTIDAMKLDKHYIDEKELWEVIIKIQNDQILEKVRF